MLSTTFYYKCGIDAIKKRARKYFEKFFELSSIDEFVKKQTIRIFYNVAQNMTDSFDAIDKSATNYARDSESMPFESLI